MRGVDAHLRDPAHLERRQCFGKLARECEVGGEIVVNEKEQPLLGLQTGDLRNDGIDRPMPRRTLEEGLHRTEIARKAAAPSGLDQAYGKVPPPAKDRSVVAHPAEVGLAVGTIDGLQPAAAGIVDDLRPQILCLADDHRLGVILHLVRHQRGVKSTHHHGHAATAEFRCDLVGALGGVGLDRNSDEIGWPVVSDRLHPIVVERDPYILRGERGERGDRQRLHLPRAHVVGAGPAPHRGMHQCQAHYAASR